MWIELTHQETLFIAFHVAGIMLCIIFSYTAGEDPDDFDY